MKEKAFNILLMAVFFMVAWMPLGRLLLFVSAVYLVISAVKSKNKEELPSVHYFFLIFFVVVLISSLHGINPVKSIVKMQKLIWYFVIPVFAILVDTKQKLKSVLYAFLAGCSVLAIYTLFYNPIMAIHNSSLNTKGLYQNFLDMGSMTDAQIFMCGAILSLVLLLLNINRNKRILMNWILFVIQLAALVITFKRGSLLIFLFISSLILIKRINIKVLLSIILLIGAVFLIPQVRTRLADLKSEVNLNKGGRLYMWEEIAPKMHKERPWFGFGWRVMTPELMNEYGKRVELHRNHLHSNLIEILVELGWFGLLAYVLWILRSLYDGYCYMRGSVRKSLSDSYFSIAIFMMLLALLLNGLIEFNMCDGEIVVIYVLLMGCAASGYKRLDFSPLGINFKLD